MKAAGLIASKTLKRESVIGNFYKMVVPEMVSLTRSSSLALALLQMILALLNGTGTIERYWHC